MPYVKIVHTYNQPNDHSRKDRSIREAVRKAITNAEKSIHIEDQYMISLEIASLINGRLHKQKNKPFKVTLVTQDDFFAGADIKFAQAMRKKFEDELYKGFTGTELNAVKQKVFIQILNPCIPPGFRHKIHSKIYIIDKELAIIGSANCSSRSMTHDTETAAIIFNDAGVKNGFVEKLATDVIEPHVLPYTPNKYFKDKDVELIDDLNNISTSKGKALLLMGLASPMLPIMISKVITLLSNRLKPAIIRYY